MGPLLPGLPRPTVTPDPCSPSARRDAIDIELFRGEVEFISVGTNFNLKK